MGCCFGSCREQACRRIVVFGSQRAGVSTVARRFAEHSNPCRRHDATDDDWAPEPLPCSGRVEHWPITRRHGFPLRVVDCGALVARLAPNAVQAALDKCDAAVMVLDATRTLESQLAEKLLHMVDASDRASDRPLVLLLNKCDLPSTALTPIAVAAALRLSQRSAPWCCVPCAAAHRFANLDGLVRFALYGCTQPLTAPLMDIPRAPQDDAPLVTLPDAGNNPSDAPVVVERSVNYAPYTDGECLRPAQAPVGRPRDLKGMPLPTAVESDAMPKRLTTTDHSKTKPRGYVRLSRA